MNPRIKVIILIIIILLGLITVTISATTSNVKFSEESSFDITSQNNWGNPSNGCNRQPRSCCDWGRSRSCC
jgi:hypothetical protein